MQTFFSPSAKFGLLSSNMAAQLFSWPYGVSSLHVLLCTFFTARPSLHVLRCTLPSLHVLCCTSFPARSLLHVLRCMFFTVCPSLNVLCCTFFAARPSLHVLCCPPTCKRSIVIGQTIARSRNFIFSSNFTFVKTFLKCPDNSQLFDPNI